MSPLHPSPHKVSLPSYSTIILQAIEHRTCSLLNESNILPTFTRLLQSDPLCAVKAAEVLAEITKNEEMKVPCIDAGLVPILIPLLDSRDQEMLLHVGRAIGRICYDNNDLQEQLVRAEVINSLVRIMSDYPDNEPLVRVNLLALSNLADLGEYDSIFDCKLLGVTIYAAKEALSKTRVAEHLVHQLQGANHHEKVEIILEVLQTLAENDTLKLQLVEAGIQEAVAEILKRLQASSKPEDMCSLKAASDLIVSLLLGDESMQQLFAEGKGVIYQNIATWLTSKHRQLQLTGALAIANFARNDSNCVQMVKLGVVHQLLDLLDHHVESGDVSVQHAALSALRNLAIPVANKIQMLEEGVANRIQMLLRSDMPPVQFKLLGTLRMLMDGQEIIKEEFKESKLVQNIHKLLRDESTGPEVKYNSIGLLCSLLNSGDLKQEAEEDQVKETLEKLCGHINENVAKQALMALQFFNDEKSRFEQ
ncbi:hypothetical protein JD844_006190 [Phrynosoma platyrhinos]|uniref:Rap1 GTPase-GDP dissociation stimulator 1 n=1 Tax=Phrynosoma platyrhinos TaxID=52577 RepID=A0ABQ7T1D4_PHRPL|nr:hypothetical protein JD844_006190 [Phrynosoma platyrhinos]